LISSQYGAEAESSPCTLGTDRHTMIHIYTHVLGHILMKDKTLVIKEIF
jgi:hypothetical protein